MTGFARAEAEAGGRTLAWELKSVNGKALDLRLRLPPGFDGLEAALKLRAAELLRRGSIAGTLTLGDQARTPKLAVNEALLGQILALIAGLDGRIEAAPPRLDGLLQIRGVLELAEPESDPDEEGRLEAAALAAFDKALSALVEARHAEGARLDQVLRGRLDEIATLTDAAVAAAATQPAAIRARFRQRLDALLDGVPPIPEERLAQELALLVQRADVREELDRLAAHVEAARALLRDGAGAGRKLDFLCQEFNREANTLCSKAAELDLTRLGLDLKAAIEQFREQVQNIE